MLSKLKFALYFIGGIALWGQWKCSSGVMVYQIYTGESTSVFNMTISNLFMMFFVFGWEHTLELK